MSKKEVCVISAKTRKEKSCIKIWLIFSLETIQKKNVSTTGKHPKEESKKEKYKSFVNQVPENNSMLHQLRWDMIT